MPAETQEPTAPETHIVDKPVVQKGSVQFMTPAAWSNPAPARLTLICNVMRNCAISLVPMVSAASIFTSSQSNTINFCLGVVAIICESIKKGTGVKPD